MAETDELEGRLCDIDHRRPAVVRVTVAPSSLVKVKAGAGLPMSGEGT